MRIPKSKGKYFYIGFAIAFGGLLLLQKFNVNLFSSDSETKNETTTTSESKNSEVVSSSKSEQKSYYYLPTSTTNQVVHHSTYSLSYSEIHEQAEWVAYVLTKEDLVNNKFKRPLFNQDPKISTKSAHWNNYKNSGFTKGHLLPAADRTANQDIYNETFLTSNISPQKQEFNSGIWNNLEHKTRSWAKKYGHIYIVTGAILENNLETIGSEKVAVPNYFYKIILRKSGNTYKSISFLIPHFNFENSLDQYTITTDKIEKLTGIDFFPFLDDEIEQEIESKVQINDWIYIKGK